MTIPRYHTWPFKSDGYNTDRTYSFALFGGAECLWKRTVEVKKPVILEPLRESLFIYFSTLCAYM